MGKRNIKVGDWLRDEGNYLYLDFSGVNPANLVNGRIVLETESGWKIAEVNTGAGLRAIEVYYQDAAEYGSEFIAEWNSSTSSWDYTFGTEFQPDSYYNFDEVIYVNQAAASYSGITILDEITYGHCGSKCKHPVYTKKELNNKLQNEVLSKIVESDNFYIAEGEITVPAMSTADDIVYLPDGWNNDNTIILSVMIKDPYNTSWDSPKPVLLDDYEYYQPDISITMGNGSFNPLIANDTYSKGTFKYKVVLLKYFD